MTFIRSQNHKIVRWSWAVFLTLSMSLMMPLGVAAAPYAAMVMDARTGEILHSRNADTRLHPASLTKMMMLYVAFEAVENNEISLDTKVLISKKAASEPPSKLGLKAGQRIALRYLIRASAIRSANDAATAIAEAISKSEAAFARRMNATAKALGMTRTTLKNAHGLTENGHLSTARDMTILGRRLFYDFPDYYNLFSRRSTHAGVRDVTNTNRKLLRAYSGADGIKTGYTRAAGFNLVASARRGNKRIIATMFGGRTAASRNARVAELLDMGFERAPKHAPVRKPDPPRYANTSGLKHKIKRRSGQTTTSLVPLDRPFARSSGSTINDVISILANQGEAELQREISEAISEISSPQRETDHPSAHEVASNESNPSAAIDSLLRPIFRPGNRASNQTGRAQFTEDRDRIGEGDAQLINAAEKRWGINIGRFNTRSQAERFLVSTSLAEIALFEDAERQTERSPLGFDANFRKLTRKNADRACRRLRARNIPCLVLDPL